MGEEDLAKATIPVTTQQKADWAARVYADWRTWKLSQPPETRGTEIQSDGQLNEILSLFIREVRTQSNAERYPGKTLCELVTSLQKYMYIHGRDVKLLTEPQFKLLQLSLDHEM